MEPLLDDATAAFLGTGCALLVGTALPDGEPVAARGFGCTTVEVGPGRALLRVLLAADDPRGFEHACVGDRVAVTATSVVTLRSVQLKGRLRGIEAPTAADDAKAVAYLEAFFVDITCTDGTPRALLQRMVPAAYVAWLVEAQELFDQTPGPSAGAALSGADR
jgi:hypothetical protein